MINQEKLSGKLEEWVSPACVVWNDSSFLGRVGSVMFMQRVIDSSKLSEKIRWNQTKWKQLITNALLTIIANYSFPIK